MDRASALYTFILQNFWTRVGLKVLLEPLICKGYHKYILLAAVPVQCIAHVRHVPVALTEKLPIQNLLTIKILH